MTAGLVACLVALAVATALGLAWRANNGKMRPARTIPVGTARASTASTSTVPASTASTSTVPASTETGSSAAAPAGGPRVTPAEIGQPLGDRATLLQFSSAFCAPCRATRRILSEVAGMTEGVAHIEIDAESRLDLVRALGVLRTPTVLVLAADGRVVRRASGQPRKADVIGALGVAVQDSGSAQDPVPAEDPNSYSSGLETGW